ncbi:MAG: polymer-forming cytoskeletal protein [bacterium]|nr:polymer-forming cytoskeletal protein [bacterium]
MFQKPTHSEPQSHQTKQHDDVETVVGPSVHVEGDFSSEGNILVKGIVSGNVRTSKLFTSEKGSRVLASVKAGSAVISGGVKGNVKIDDRLELTASAQILGDIECGVLVVEAGALIKGKVTMKGIEIEDPKSDKKPGLLGGRTSKEVEKES